MQSFDEGQKKYMRAMRTERIPAVTKDLKLVGHSQTGKSRMDGYLVKGSRRAGVTPLDYTDSLRTNTTSRKAPLVLGNGKERRCGGGGGGNELSCRFTCDVHQAIGRIGKMERTVNGLPARTREPFA